MKIPEVCDSPLRLDELDPFDAVETDDDFRSRAPSPVGRGCSTTEHCVRGVRNAWREICSSAATFIPWTSLGFFPTHNKDVKHPVFVLPL